MKKLLLITVLSILSMAVSAQIQRQFMGQTLGVSTKSEVFKNLESKGAFYEQFSGEETICVKDIRFGGYSWSIAVFNFYENKLAAVIFSDLETPDKDSGEAKWNVIIDKLSSKYEKYKKNDTSTDDCITYTDKKTYLSIAITDGRITMGYSDLELAFKKRYDEENEL